MKSLRAKSVGSAGPESEQQRIEKAFDVPRGAQADTVFKIFFRDERGRMKYLDALPFGDLSAQTIHEVIKETFGGGRFHVLPVTAGGKSGEGFELVLDGASKIKKLAEKVTATTRKSKARESDELEEIRAKLELLEGQQKEEALKGWFRGEMESQMQSLEAKLSAEHSGKSNVLDQLVANLPAVVPVVLDGLRSLSSRDPGPDMISQVRDVLSLVNELTPAAPPVTTAQPAGVFGESGIVSAVVEAGVRGYMASKQGQQPALPGVAPQPAGAEAPGASAGFGGVPGVANAEAAGQAAAPTANAEAAGQAAAPTAGVNMPANPLAVLSLENFGVLPMKRLAQMLIESRPVEEVAETIVDLLGFAITYGATDQIKAIFWSYMANPEEAFDKIRPLIPQVEDAVYSANLKQAVVQEFDAYIARQAEEEEEEDLYEAEETEDTPEAQHAAEGLLEEQDTKTVDESVVTAEEPTE